jgi:phosphomethylpyrimidine synthase
MKITQEVRDFAGKQNQGVEGFIATGPTGAETAAASKAAAIKGMEEMSALYNASGRELYIGAGGRERD